MLRCIWTWDRYNILFPAVEHSCYQASHLIKWTYCERNETKGVENLWVIRPVGTLSAVLVASSPQKRAANSEWGSVYGVRRQQQQQQQQSARLRGKGREGRGVELHTVPGPCSDFHDPHETRSCRRRPTTWIRQRTVPSSSFSLIPRMFCCPLFFFLIPCCSLLSVHWILLAHLKLKSFREHRRATTVSNWWCYCWLKARYSKWFRR